ncbi:rho GTPase-activating protein 45 isoform X1 [Aplysia californica]|uniref:Rho GTPase-activating protein 45 isoform X1 n=3 Tax=Aplysia californica TaxID=6500 RepID=A0ABM1VYA9_APLCA|nr:rho GTPase-activating protein 45 isoform X1 [Aplysia californica]
MSSKGRQIAKSIGKSIKRKFEADFFQFPFGLEEQQRDLIFLPAPPFNTSPHGSPPLSVRKLMQQKMQSLPSPKKSSSLGTIATGDQQNPGMIDHDEIIALTHDVKKFSDSLAKLKLLFTEGIDPEEDVRVVIHEGLGEVLSVLNPVMQHYQDLQSPDIFTAARNLITMIKDHDYEGEMSAVDVQGFCEAIDQLALAFSSSVSEYLMGDMGPQMVMDLKTKSMNNIAVAEGDEHMDDHDADMISSEELDSILVSLDTGLTIALQRAKVWSKYLLDIVTYIEKKAQLEIDYAKNLSRVAHSVQNSLKKEGFLPLQSVYCTALSQDVEFASNLQATQAVLHSHKFVEPLSSRRMEHDKVYKSVKDVWHREYRRMSDSVTNLRKAQALYHSRQQDHERARDLALKADGEKVEKRRKAEEETLHKAAEAETTYKACVAEANYRQQELFKVKKEQLARIREQIQLCDQVIQSATVEYFQLYHTVISPIPVQYQTLSDSSKSYEPGSQYAEYIRRLPLGSRHVQPEVFVFEPYVHGQKASPEGIRKESFHSNGSMADPLHSPEGSPTTSPRRDKYRIPVKAWGQQPHGTGTSDTDSNSCSSKSHESSPSGSPHRASRRHLISSQSLDELTEEEILAASAQNGQEKRSQMKRTMTLGGEENLDIPGLLMHHRGRRNTTFGVDFQEQVDTFQTTVPPIVSKCLMEIERRGVMIKGIYRVSGVKSRVEQLCQKFDIDPEAVDLTDIPPNIISNVLKLYLRQLPEPLLTFRLYSDFIHTAKENMSGQLLGDNLVAHLKTLVAKLPSSNLRTCAVLMHHLQRVAAHADLNHMSASNLGIVFGPTLLRPLEGSASLASLVDTPHQTRAIDLLITNAHVIFGPSEDFQVAPSQTPIEQLNQALDGVLMPGQHLADHAQMQKQKQKSPDVSSQAESQAAVVVSEPAVPSAASSATQPCASEYLLPGSVSQELQDCQNLSVNVPGTSGTSTAQPATEESSSTPQSEPYLKKPTVTKSASSPLVSHRTYPSQMMTSSASVPGASDSSGTDMASALSSAASGMAASLLRSSSSFTSSQLSSTLGYHSLTTSASTGSFSSQDLETRGMSKSPVPMTEEVAKLSVETKPSGEEGNTECSAGEKQKLEELARKKAHSHQLENIKYLTKAPSVEETGDNFYPKINLVSSGGLPVTHSLPCMPKMNVVPADAVVDSSSPSHTETTTAVTAEQEPVPVSTTDQPVQNVPEAPPPPPPPSSSSSSSSAAPNAAATGKPSAVLRQPMVDNRGFSSRKSVLEEMPIPTVSKPMSPTSDGSETGGAEEGPVPAVTLPASPTIKRREMPSRIPTSPTIPRHGMGAKRGDKGDKRADQFKLEQRKLVMAIKSDAKITGPEDDKKSESDQVLVTGAVSPRASTSSSPKVKRKSGLFDDALSGGCALSASSHMVPQEPKPTPQSAEEVKPKTESPQEVEMKMECEEKLETPKESCAAQQGMFSPEVKKSTTKASGSPVSSRSSASSHTSVGQSKTGARSKSDTSKSDGQSSPRQKTSTISEGGVRPGVGRGRALAMPSTVFTKKSSPASSPGKGSPKVGSGSTPSSTRPLSSPAACSLTKRTAADQNSSPSSTRASTSSSAKQSGEGSSPSATPKSGSPLAKKLSGRSTDSPAAFSTRSTLKSSGSGPKTGSPPKGDVAARVERFSSSSTSQSSSSSLSSRQRKPSGEGVSASSSRTPTKPVLRKTSSGSSGGAVGSSGSPRRIHERCQQEKPSPSQTTGKSSASSAGKTSSSRPAQLSSSTTTATTATSSSSPVTTPTSTTGKLSQDRTPRFV